MRRIRFLATRAIFYPERISHHHLTGDDTMVQDNDNHTTVLTPNEVILHSASLLGKTIDVQGMVVLLDWDLHRIDIAHNGAKLILRLPPRESIV